MPPSPPPPPQPSTSPPPSFLRRKALILAQLAVPAEQYDDLSPKGSVDEGIRELIEGINAREGWVTTSSCAGRVSVFAEGRKRSRTDRRTGDGGGEGSGGGGNEEGRNNDPGPRKDELHDGGGGGGGEEEEEDEDEDGHVEGERAFDGNEYRGREKMTLAGAGGKGGGGRWLFVSHEAVDMDGMKGKDIPSYLGMRRRKDLMESVRQFTEERLIHFKFEPMILHILTASLTHAQTILKAALQAGFRESGALNLTSATSKAPTPMVAVRSTGLALDSVVGWLDNDGEGISIVSDTFLEGLLAVANERFEENSRRITRFRDLVLSSTPSPAVVEAGKKSRGGEWEDASARRERKRAEGLRRSQELRGMSDS